MINEQLSGMDPSCWQCEWKVKSVCNIFPLIYRVVISSIGIFFFLFSCRIRDLKSKPLFNEKEQLSGMNASCWQCEWKVKSVCNIIFPLIYQVSVSSTGIFFLFFFGQIRDLESKSLSNDREQLLWMDTVG